MQVARVLIHRAAALLLPAAGTFRATDGEGPAVEARFAAPGRSRIPDLECFNSDECGGCQPCLLCLKPDAHPPEPGVGEGLCQAPHEQLCLPPVGVNFYVQVPPPVARARARDTSLVTESLLQEVFDVVSIDRVRKWPISNDFDEHARDDS
ncbi:hypothetical protein GCM10010169_35900 [Micromonospora fulviviridis]|nr:hypothetical protein GCM10010169_35900 [Micromonospora fulviviridis]